jgi:hypothetical protein
MNNMIKKIIHLEKKSFKEKDRFFLLNTNHFSLIKKYHTFSNNLEVYHLLVKIQKEIDVLL